MVHLSVGENMTLPVLKRISRYGFINGKKERSVVGSLISRFRIKITSPEQAMESLSGGNQQKVIILRFLLTEAAIFILDEPTRGIDVGVKYEFCRIMNDLTGDGKGIIFILSVLPEIVGVSDRILCIKKGKLVRTFECDEAGEENIMRVLLEG